MHRFELSEERLEVLLEELQEHAWALAEEASGKFEPRPGSPRDLARQRQRAVEGLVESLQVQREQE